MFDDKVEERLVIVYVSKYIYIQNETAHEKHAEIKEDEKLLVR